MSIDKLKIRVENLRMAYQEAVQAYAAALKAEQQALIGAAPDAPANRPKPSKRRGWPKGKKRGPRKSPKDSTFAFSPITTTSGKSSTRRRKASASSAPKAAEALAPVEGAE